MTLSLRTGRIYIVIVSVVFLMLGSVTSVDAALLYLDPSEETLYRGDTVTLNVRVVTDPEECINTADVTVRYDEGMRAVDVGRGSSIINLWLDDPEINEQARTITFAGGIVGGYCGRIPGDPSYTNILAELVFRAPGLSIGTGAAKPSGRVWIDEESTQVLLHDGLATRATLRTESTNVIISDSAGSAIDDSWRSRVADDSTPPADFQIELSRDENGEAFGGRYFITFNSNDKQSGIDHHEVMEEPISDLYSFKWGRADAPWVREESPYVLKDQKLNSTIRVRAIDKAGNETIAVLIPPEALRLLSTDRVITLSLLGFAGFFMLAVVAYLLYRRKQIRAVQRLNIDKKEHDTESNS